MEINTDWDASQQLLTMEHLQLFFWRNLLKELYEASLVLRGTTGI
jgi:hypothetical protein